MKSRILKRTCIAAMLLLVLGVASSAWAAGYSGGVPWQVGDVVICFGSGTCNVVRIVNGSPVLLDQISDLAQPSAIPPIPGVTNPGGTRGVAINNTLHAVVTDNGSGTGSNVVVYSIASVNPLTGTAIAHTPVTAPFNGSTDTSSNAQDIAVDSVGHMYVGNGVSAGGQASIVELKPNGDPLSSFLIPNATTPAWVANNPYAVNATVLDPNGHVQKVITAGTSGPLFPPFNQFGGQATDGLIWQDQGSGSATPWAPSTFYAVGATVLDTNSMVEQAVAAGTSGGGSGPVWGTSVGATTIDNAVTWQDQTSPVSGPCIENQLNSLDLNAAGDTVYFTSGPGGIIQKVTAGLSTCTVFADFGPNVTLHSIKVIPADALPTNCNSSVLGATASCPRGEALLVVASGTQFVDEDLSDLPGGSNPDSAEFSSGQDIFDICTDGPELTPTPAPPGPSGSGNSCALLVDGSGHIVSRYPISTSSPLGTLQALSLDPLVTDCTGGCSAWQATHAYALGATILDPASHVQKVTTAGTSGGNQPIFNDSGGTTSDGGATWTDQGRTSVNNFWLGDSQSSNFYRLDFATGTPSAAFNANADCATHSGCNSTFASVQGMRIYAGEGANQPDLTKLFSTGSFPNMTMQKVQFPLPTNATDTNTMAVEIFNLPSPTSLSLYASQLPMASAVSGGNNSGASDPPGSFPCQPTTGTKANCIVWKVDTNAPNTATVATKFSTVNTMAPTIDTNTDVFVDESYDVTTFVGNFDPGGGRISVHSLHEVAAFANSTEGGSCAYTSPAPKCFKNPGNITFKFSCPNFFGDVSTLHPQLSLIKPPPGTPNSVPQPILPLPATGTNAGNYRFNGTQWVFNWQAQDGVFRATTIDLNHHVQTFFEDFTVSNACSSSVTISSVTPNFGAVGGGTKVTITGVGYVSGATVQFGTGNFASQASVKVASNGKSITATTPSAPGGIPGPVDVIVTNPGSNGTATFFSGYTYQ